MSMSPSEVRPYYDSYWTQARTNPFRLQARFHDELAAYVQPESRVLDFGCGDGSRYGRWLSERAESYFGLDVSEVAVERAVAAGRRAARIESESDFGVPSDEFDVVVANRVLEHLFAPQAAVRELHRVLVLGGTLIATVPNVAYWPGRVRLGLFGRWNAGGDARSDTEPWRDPHLRFFTVANLRDLLQGAGFTRVELSGYDGALLAELPVSRRFWRRRGSAPYRQLESRFPGLLGAGLIGVARKG
jgi:methionine biosynthesis protein MetW